ncbi:MAG: hypothetical protein AB7P03_21415 [Kofleriaceae bacterium]
MHDHRSNQKLPSITAADLESVQGGQLAGPIVGAGAGAAFGEIAKHVGKWADDTFGKKSDNASKSSDRNDCIKLVKDKSADDINKICGKPK